MRGMTSTPALDRLPGLDPMIRALLRDWRVPGLALAVIANDEVVAARGYGYADIAQKRPVTPDTTFAIGSCTKAFTTTALAMLVERGALDWDRPVRDYLPGFRLFDEVAGARVTARDLACHRTGLPSHDPVWYRAGASRHEIVKRLAYLAPSRDFRSAYQYNNLMYIAAGVLVEAITGQTWEDFTRRRILEPLGMRRTSFSPARALALGGLALPYMERAGHATRIPFMSEGEDALSSAGWIHASVVEMIPWLRLHLAGGAAPGAGQLVAADRLAETHTPQVVAPEPTPMFSAYPELAYMTYGLGWRNAGYRGNRMVMHGGAIDGYCAHTSFMPGQGIGVVVLSNLDGQPAAQIAAYRVYDLLLGLEPIDWNARIRARTAEVRAATEASLTQARAARVDPSVTPEPASACAGRYRHPGYGHVSVTAEGDAISLTHNALSYSGSRLGANAFELTNELIGRPRFVRFMLDAAGRVSALAIQFELGVEEIVFQRIPQGKESPK